LRTNVPIGDVITSPSSPNAASTFLAVVVATPYVCEIVIRLGTTSPGASSPLMIWSRSTA
jgi:hypothetical protein